MGSIKFITSMTMITLFTIAVIVFATQFGVENQADVLLSEESSYDTIKTEMVGNTSSMASSINGSSDTFFTTTQEQGDQSSSSGGQFKGGIKESLAMATSAIGAGFSSIFGNDDSSSGNGFYVFFTALTSVLLFMLIAYGWKYWRGNPD